jgi:hypothetical protein
MEEGVLTERPSVFEIEIVIKVKGTAIPVTGRRGSYGCETSRLPRLLDTPLTDGVEVVHSYDNYLHPTAWSHISDLEVRILIIGALMPYRPIEVHTCFGVKSASIFRV